MSTETPPTSLATGQNPAVELDVWISALGRMSAAHPDMARILHVVDRLQDRPYRSHVILRGEPGTGKEGLAKLIHRMMHPSGGPCERVSLIGRTPEQIATDLFGDDAGGGALARAAGGSLILDEILALPPEAQRRLHERISAARWGAQAAVVIALSDGDVGQAVASGALRHDLAYKLGRILLTVPPLRERPEDLSHAALWTANRILRSRGIGVGVHRGAELIEVTQPGDSTEVAAVTADDGPEPYRVTSTAVAALGRYSETVPPTQAWPGNFRELEAVLERAILLYSDGEVLRAADVERALADSAALIPNRRT